MANKIINTFGGINTDTSINKYPNNKYYGARNFRPISNESLSSGALTNVLAPLTEDSIGTSAGVILGTTLIRDTLVIFYANTATNSSEIYKLEYDSANIELVYSDVNSITKLGFNANNPIKAVGRYENVDIQKVYWCDGSNPNAFINIADTYDMGVGTSFEASLLRLSPDAELNSPQPSEVLSGGSLESGIVYYTYQLYRENGNQTVMSPSSFGVPLTSRSGNELDNFRGDELGVNTGKSVKVIFNNLDSNFDKIKIYSLHFSDINADPTISLIRDQSFTSTTATVIDTGSIELEALSTEQFLLMGGRIFSSKTLETKYNYLFPANITEVSSDIDYDARAYRAKVSQRSGITGTVTIINAGAGTVEISMDGDIGETGSSVALVFQPDGVSRTYSVATKTLTVPGTVDYLLTIPAYIGIWAGATNYNIGDIVYDSGVLYRCIVNHSSAVANQPPYAPYWDEFINATSTVESSVGTTTFIVYDESGSSTTLIPATWSSFSEEEDAINYFNNFDNDLEWARPGGRSSLYEYKYQSDGENIGGSGPKVSYRFVTQRIEANTDASIKGSVLLRSLYNKDNSFLNPILSGKYKGYKRNETYRVGLEFLFKNGQKSFVKWVGDIRFPNAEDKPLTEKVGNKIYNLQLGLQLTISTLNLDPDVINSLSGIRVVRAERSFNDKNILGQGLIGPYQEVPYDNLSTPNSWGSYPKIPSIQDITSGTISILNSDITEGVGNEAQDVDLSDTLYEMNSPEFQISTAPVYTSGDKLSMCTGLILDSDNGYTKSSVASPTGYFRQRNYIQDSYSFGYNQVVDGSTITSVKTTGNDGTSLSNFGGETINNRTIVWKDGADYNAIRGSHLLLDIDNSTTLASKLSNLDFSTTTSTIIADYVRNNFSAQYGGNTYDARTLTNYISTVVELSSGDVVEMIPMSAFGGSSSITVDVYGGDTYVSNYDMIRSSFDQDVSTEWSLQEYITFPVETAFNLDYRRDEIIKYHTGLSEFNDDKTKYKLQQTKAHGITLFPESYPDEVTDLYLYNDAYSRNNNIRTNTVKPSDFLETSNFDTMVTASNKKFNGESVDSWSLYNFNTLLEVDSTYGPLNVLKLHNNKLFYFQNHAHGILAVEDREQISGNSGVALSLGTGAVLERYDYLSTHFGALRDESVLATPNNLYFIDESDKSIRIPSNTDANGNLSEFKGVSYKVNTLLPSTYIALGYDAENKEVLFSFDSSTLVYSEMLNEFIGDYDISAHKTNTLPSGWQEVNSYETINDKLYSIYRLDYINTMFVDKYNAATSALGDYSEVTLLIHPNGNDIFTFDNLDIRTNVFDAFTKSLPVSIDELDDTVHEIDYKNSYLPLTTVTTNPGLSNALIHRLVRAWRTQVPQTTNNNRFVDSYLMVTLRYNNSVSNKIVLHDITTYVRPAKIRK